MFPKKDIQGGFTLIEVLVSVVLLFIILTSFMGFFTQSALFSKHNEKKYGAMQTAQSIINLIEMNVTKQTLQDHTIIDPLGNVYNKPRMITKGQIEEYIGETIDPSFTVSGVITNNSSAENLIQFKVIVEDSQNANDHSETYTYIRR